MSSIEEYQDGTYDWSFVELTERMKRFVLEDQKNARSPKKNLDRPAQFRTMDNDNSQMTNGKVNGHIETSAPDISPVEENLKGSALQLVALQNHHGSSMDKLKESLLSWDFDIFALNSLTDGHAIQAVAYEIFNRHKLLQRFRLSENHFMRFIIQIERHYRSNPYHNATHAADVLQTANTLIVATGFHKIMTDLEIFCILITAAMHDIEHTGTNNSFHKNSGSEMATMYVVSVLENHHIRIALRMLRQFDILGSLTAAQYEEFKFMLISMILSTDMSHHFSLMTNFKLLTVSPVKCKTRIRIKRLLMLLIHAADISNPAKPWSIHKVWVTVLMQEFFLQGDKENELGLPVTTNCDKTKANIATLQIGFMDIFTQETFDILENLLNQEMKHAGVQPYNQYKPWQDCMVENAAKWAGKWKDFKIEQIDKLLTETAESRKSMCASNEKKSQTKESSGPCSWICCRQCCRCLGRKRGDNSSFFETSNS